MGRSIQGIAKTLCGSTELLLLAGGYGIPAHIISVSNIPSVKVRVGVQTCELRAVGPRITRGKPRQSNPIKGNKY